MTALTQYMYMAIRLQRKVNPAYANDNTLPQYLNKSELQRAVGLSPPDRHIVSLIRDAVAKYKTLCPGSYGSTRADADLNDVVKSGPPTSTPRPRTACVRTKPGQRRSGRASQSRQRSARRPSRGWPALRGPWNAN